MAVILVTGKAPSVENMDRRLSFSSRLGGGNSSTNSGIKVVAQLILFHGMSLFYIKRRELFKKLELDTKLWTSKKAKQIGKGFAACHSR